MASLRKCSSVNTSNNNVVNYGKANNNEICRQLRWSHSFSSDRQKPSVTTRKSLSVYKMFETLWQLYKKNNISQLMCENTSQIMIFNDLKHVINKDIRTATTRISYDMKAIDILFFAVYYIFCLWNWTLVFRA